MKSEITYPSHLAHPTSLNLRLASIGDTVCFGASPFINLFDFYSVTVHSLSVLEVSTVSCNRVFCYYFCFNSVGVVEKVYATYSSVIFARIEFKYSVE